MKKILNIAILVLLLFATTSKGQVCFNAQPITPTNNLSPVRQMCKADFNNDGIIDLASANVNGTVTVYLCNGQGGFSSILNDSVTNYLQCICTGDFNNDSIMDLAMYNSGFGETSILIGNGNGTFNHLSTGAIGGIWNPNASLVSLDFNGDGNKDLILSNGFQNEALLALGNGNGSFSAQTIIPNCVGLVNGEIITADFNNDGRDDFATCSASFWVNVFTIATADTLGESGSITTADFNGDGNLDIVNATNKNGYFGFASFFKGNGNGSFDNPIDFTLGDSTSISSAYGHLNANAICNGDFNNDGKLDVAISAKKYIPNEPSSPNKIVILLGNGSGGFGTPIDFTTTHFINSIASVDMNVDGKMDLIYAETGSVDAHLVVLLNCSPTGINEIDNQTIQLFPNPTQGEITIKAMNIIDEIKATDILGETIILEKPNKKELKISLVNKGIYFIQIQMNHQTYFQKIVNN